MVVGSTDFYGSNGDFALTRLNVDGSVDTTFGTNGVVTTNFFGRNDVATSVAIQPDGKIVVAGYARQSKKGFDFALARYHINGSLDRSFGQGGKVTTDFFTKDDHVYAMALQRDGQIVVAGSARKVTGDKSDDFALARYDGNGSLDQSFGLNGKVNTDFCGADDAVYSLVLQPDGKVVVAGEAFQPEKSAGGSDQDRFTAALARYKANGRLDRSFGQQGKVLTVFTPENPDEIHSSINDLALESKRQDCRRWRYRE